MTRNTDTHSRDCSRCRFNKQIPTIEHNSNGIDRIKFIAYQRRNDTLIFIIISIMYFEFEFWIGEMVSDR